ncbi:MAG: PQQ-binding-like beta-propeller repeat protein [Pseudomonadota bacterium]
MQEFTRKCVASALATLAALFSIHSYAIDCEDDEIDSRAVVNGWGFDRTNHRFLSESQAGITPDNLQSLKLQWVYALPDTDAPRFNPLITPDTVFVTDGSGGVYALDRSTGCEKWRHSIDSTVRTALRKVVSGEDELLVFGTLDGDLIALDLQNGSKVWKVRLHPHPKAMLSGSAVDHEGIIYQPVSSWEVAWALNPFYGCCTFRGAVVAVSAADGEIVWRGYTIEEEPKLTRERLLLPDQYGPSGAPVWSQPTLDLERRRLYVGTGQNYSSPATNTSDAILAFDLETGALVWKQQMLANDAWNLACIGGMRMNCPEERGDDLDFGAPPILVEVDGRDFLLAGQKGGRVYALDPDRDGALIWTRKAGAGGKAGGIHFAMAVNASRGVLYVPISDRGLGSLLGTSNDGEPNPSLQALDIPTGRPLWMTPAPGDCMENREGSEPRPMDDCFRGFSAAVTATERLVVAPALDGYLRIFDANSGEQIWEFNTAIEYDAVNGGKAQGGALDLGGAVMSDGQLFIPSGYSLFGQMGGNAFMVFGIEE